MTPNLSAMYDWLACGLYVALVLGCGVVLWLAMRYGHLWDRWLKGWWQ